MSEIPNNPFLYFFKQYVGKTDRVNWCDDVAPFFVCGTNCTLLEFSTSKINNEWQSRLPKCQRRRWCLGFGTEVEECKLSEGRLSCLYIEQEKPEPVEMMVLVNKHFKVILCLEQI